MEAPDNGLLLLTKYITEHSPGEQRQKEACENVQLFELNPYEHSQDLVESEAKTCQKPDIDCNLSMGQKNSIFSLKKHELSLNLSLVVSISRRLFYW